MEKYYLYRHIRLDKNEPFYIGIGKVHKNSMYSKTDSEHYKRAYSKKDRSKFWNSIVNKTKYTIEIILESDNWEYIVEKEKEFIILYGRRDLGLGTLCNLTSGGEGKPNFIVTKETKNKQSEAAKKNMIGDRLKENSDRLKRVNPLTGKFGKEHCRAIKVYQYDLDWNYINEFDTLSLARDITGTQISHLSQCLNNKRKTTNGFKWSKFRI